MTTLNLYLIGYRGTGKTTIAEQLSRLLGVPWCDSDTEIQKLAGTSIAEIFSRQGEDAFRDLESSIIQDIASKQRLIVSLGGGAVLRPVNQQAIRTSGKTIWLTAEPETLDQRIHADSATAKQRPNLTTKTGITEIREVLQTREPIYRGCADFEISTEDFTPEAVCEQILPIATDLF